MKLDLTLGRTVSGRPITVTKASNPHIYVTGRSGSGKSYFLKGLVMQAAAQGALCLVFDYTGDYRSYTPPDETAIRKIAVSSPEFTMNPLLGLAGQSPELRAQQFLSLIHSAFRLGPRASLLLRQAVLTYLWQEQGLPSLRKLILSIQSNERHGRGTVTVVEPLELMNSILTCGTAPISLDLTSPGITVLDFGDIVDVRLRNLLISMILTAIWNQRIASISTDPPIVLLMDEAQTLHWGSGSMAKRILCEGRKYGLAGWFATQWISNKEVVSALEQAYLRVHFRPDEENVNRLAKRLTQGNPQQLDACVRMIRGLRVGQGVWQKPEGQLIKFQSDFHE